MSHLPADIHRRLDPSNPWPLGAIAAELDAADPQGMAEAREWARKSVTAGSLRVEPLPPAVWPEPIAQWGDPRVQLVYNILANTDDVPPPEQHWEGWAARRIVDALGAPAAPSVPDGWKLVPVEPTPEMLDPRTPFIGGTFPFGDSTAEYISTGRRASWAAMLAAAPAAPQEPARVALTLDYIEQHIGLDEGDREAVVALVREVERAHGIPGTDGAEHG